MTHHESGLNPPCDLSRSDRRPARWSVGMSYLTPREAARIQGYPDSYDFFPDPKNPPKKSKLTKWIGDAVPMPLGYIAGMSALAADLRPFVAS